MILCEIREVWKASFFSIICDETKDLSEKEQLSVDVRYFYAAKLTKNFSVSVLLKASLLRLLLKYITVALSDIRLCVGQSYDGATVMSAVYPVFSKE